MKEKIKKLKIIEIWLCLLAFISIGSFGIYKIIKQRNKIKDLDNTSNILVQEKIKCETTFEEKDALIKELTAQLEEKDKNIENNKEKIKELESKNSKLTNEINTLKKN